MRKPNKIMSKVNKKVANILRTLYNIVLSEEQGYTEKISEYFFSDELEDLLNELNIPIEEDDVSESNIDDRDMEYLITDFFDAHPRVKYYNEDVVKYYLQEVTGLNKAAKEIFKKKLKERLHD